MNCTICSYSFDHRSHIPKVLSCCGKSLCTHCCTQLDKDSKSKCPFCRKDLKSKFMSLAKNSNLLESINEGCSTTCLTHGKLNEMICETCEMEICTKCIESHSGPGHDLSSTEGFLTKIRSQVQDYDDWMNRAASKSSQYTKIIEKAKSFLKKEVNTLFDNLIKNIRTHQEKAIKEIEERYKAKDIISYYFQEDLDILKLIEECKEFVKPETANLKLPQKVRFLKKKQLKPLMDWSNRDDSEALTQILDRTKAHFNKECPNPFKLVINDEPILKIDNSKAIELSQLMSKNVIIGILDKEKLNILKPEEMKKQTPGQNVTTQLRGGLSAFLQLILEKSKKN